MGTTRPEDLFRKRLDQYLDRYQDDIGPAKLEQILQERAQDMRELAAESGEEAITANDLDGWSADSEG